ncbi:hypothetical protein ACWDSJ_05820 [Nocardia sp. NPDC003482]
MADNLSAGPDSGGELVATWRDRVSESAQNDLDGLLDTALTMAEERLGAEGVFHPFGLVVAASTGGTDVVSLPFGPSDRARDNAFRAVRGMRSRIRAAAVVVDVRLPETGGDGVDVFLEHAEGVALSVLEPYRIEDGEVRPEPLEAHSEARRIWS